MKERLDVLLVDKNYFPSREQAKRSIMAGIVFVNGQRSDKAGNLIDVDSEIEVRENICPYVSRGGLKLEKSIKLWPIDLEGATCMDIGSSTGGFTDCMLQNGASKVYALDVGTNQLDYKLRIDPRVVVMEKTNIRTLDVSTIEPLDFISIDVSFISLKLVLPVATRLLKPEGKLVMLVKPQFEAGREQVGKNGIVKDPRVHIQVIKNVVKYSVENDLVPAGLTFSPVTGAKGNIEYLLFTDSHFTEPVTEDDITDIYSTLVVESIVKDSHENLK